MRFHNARILKTTRVPIDKYLHAARREARLCASRPAALRIFGQKRSAREVPVSPEGSQEFFLALRRQIFLSRGAGRTAYPTPSAAFATNLWVFFGAPGTRGKESTSMLWPHSHNVRP